MRELADQARPRMMVVRKSMSMVRKSMSMVRESMSMIRKSMSMVLISLLGAEDDNRKPSRTWRVTLLYNPNPLAYFGITYIHIDSETHGPAGRSRSGSRW